MATLLLSIAKLVLYIFLPGYIIKVISSLRWPFSKAGNGATANASTSFSRSPSPQNQQQEQQQTKHRSHRHVASTTSKFNARSQSHPPPHGRTFWLETKWDNLIKVAALSIALYYTFLLVRPFVPLPSTSFLSPSSMFPSMFGMTNSPANKDVFGGKDLFQLVDADYNAQGWQLRNAVRDYKKLKARHDDTFNQHLKKQAEAVVPDEEDDNDRVVGSSTGPTSKREIYDLLSPVAKLDHVYERVKSTENRKFYLLFGHDSFIRCHWCAEETDYFVFHLTSVGLQYAVAACFLGLLTTVRSRQGWRTRGASIILTLAAAECLFYYLPAEYRNDIVHTFSPPPALDQSIFFDDLLREHFVPIQQYLMTARYLALMSLFTLIAFRKRGHEIPDTLLLERVTKSQQQFFARMQALHAAQEAIQRDPALRQKMAETQRRRRDEDDAFMSMPGIRQAVATAREKHNMTQIEQDAAEAAEDVVALGKRIATTSSSSAVSSARASPQPNVRR